MRSYPVDDQIDLLCDQFETEISRTSGSPPIRSALEQVSAEKRPRLLFWLLSIYLQHQSEESSVDEINCKTLEIDTADGELAKYQEVVSDALDARHSNRLGLPFVPGFQVQSLAASGGQGEVYRAIQRHTEQVVAIKFVSRERLRFLTRDDADRVLRLLQEEIRTTARLQHPNIVKIYDAGVCDAGVFFVMQWVQGGTLHDAANLPPVELASLMADLTFALHHAHQQGVYHLDIKPQNILIDEISGQALLADFGLANLAAASDALGSGIAGTPGYMAPEQIAAKPVDARTDLYALGVTFYEKLTGERFQIEPSRETSTASDPKPPVAASQSSEASVHTGRKPASDEDLLNICRRCTHTLPADRYQSCLELTEDLRQYAATADARRIAEIGGRTIKMSPFVMLINCLVWLQIQAGWAEQIFTEFLIWGTMFCMYPLVFVVLGTLSKLDRHSPEHLALESLWAIWIGKCIAALTIAGSLRLFFMTVSTQLGVPSLSAGRSAILLAYPMFSALTGLLMIALAPRYWRPLQPLGISACLHSFIILGATLLGTTLAPILYGMAATSLAVLWGFHLKRLLPASRQGADEKIPSTVAVNTAVTTET
ncbi:MAG: serine/threonine-protein kinase [Rubripirellula sp.]